MALLSLLEKSWFHRATKQDLLTLCEKRTYDGKIILSRSVFVRSGATY